MQAILARRLAGERVSLPLDPPSRPLVEARRLVLVGLGTAAALLLLSRLSNGPSRSDHRGSPLQVPSLYAQVSDRPTFPLVRQVRPLRPGRWRYALTQGAGIEPSSEWEQRLGMGQYDGIDAYVYNYGPGASLSDTLWLRQTTLRPLARGAGTAIGTHVTQVFKEAEVLNGVTTAQGMTEWRSVAFDSLGPRVIGRGRAPADSYGPPNLTQMWRPQIAATLGAAELGPGWRGSMEAISAPVNFMAMRFWLNLEVVGEERVTVPGGTFDAWKIRVGKRAGYYAWVSKDRQWLIQLGPEGAAEGRQVLLEGLERE